MSKQIDEVMGWADEYAHYERMQEVEKANRYRELIEEKLRELVPVWQPIESAPDEEWLMVWVTVDECASIAQKSDGLWFDEYGLMQDAPSFYMPLPKAPG